MLRVYFAEIQSGNTWFEFLEELVACTTLSVVRDIFHYFRKVLGSLFNRCTTVNFFPVSINTNAVFQSERTCFQAQTDYTLHLAYSTVLYVDFFQGKPRT